MGLCEIFDLKKNIWVCFKNLKRTKVSLKSDKNDGYFYMKIYVYLWQYLTEFFSEWEMFQTKVIQKIKIQTLSSWRFLQKNCTVCEVMWKSVIQLERPQITIWSMCIACWIAKVTDTRLEYCCSMAAVVTQMFLNVTFIHSLPILLLIWTQEQYSEFCVPKLLFYYTLSCTGAK